MSKANRETITGIVTTIVVTIFFWVSIVTAVLGELVISVITTIGYVSTIILLEHLIYGKEISVKKRVIIFLGMCCIQLVPYALILIIRRLVG